MSPGPTAVRRSSWGLVALGLLAGCATASRPAALPSNWDDHYLDLAVDRSSTRPTLAVLPFGATDRVKATTDFRIGDVLTTTLFKTGRFDLVERDRLDEILKEQRFGRSGLVDESTAARIGKLSGAAAVVFGVLSSATQQQYDRFSYDLIRTEVRVDARAVDTATGRLIFTESAEGASETKVITDARGTVISGAVDPRSEYSKATAQATLVLAEKLARQFPVMGFVIAVSGGSMVVDIGSSRDVAARDRLVVIRPLERLVHPVTKKPAGWRKAVLASGEVQAVEATSSTASLVPAGEGAQPVKPGDIVVLAKD
jgi:curli biogenesis system outer membrane secretion channel CsgG